MDMDPNAYVRREDLIVLSLSGNGWTNLLYK